MSAARRWNGWPDQEARARCGSLHRVKNRPHATALRRRCAASQKEIRAPNQHAVAGSSGHGVLATPPTAGSRPGRSPRWPCAGAPGSASVVRRRVRFHEGASASHPSGHHRHVGHARSPACLQRLRHDAGLPDCERRDVHLGRDPAEGSGSPAPVAGRLEETDRLVCTRRLGCEVRTGGDRLEQDVQTTGRTPGVVRLQRHTLDANRGLDRRSRRSPTPRPAGVRSFPEVTEPVTRPDATEHVGSRRKSPLRRRILVSRSSDASHTLGRAGRPSLLRGIAGDGQSPQQYVDLSGSCAGGGRGEMRHPGPERGVLPRRGWLPWFRTVCWSPQPRRSGSPRVKHGDRVPGQCHPVLPAPSRWWRGYSAGPSTRSPHAFRPAPAHLHSGLRRRDSLVPNLAARWRRSSGSPT